jgi:23S rRNA pseudouridine1911/1915/1917 synthase
MSTRARRARDASTRVLSVEPLGDVSLVRLTIGTGRTHQIRVHLSEAGYPVVGDPVYGGGRKPVGRIRQRPDVSGSAGGLARLARPFLHAASISFTQPTTGEPLRIDAPLAADLAALLDALRSAAR